jgi:L-2-hydroxyglutarate oxidase
VATDESELPALRRLVARAQANGLAVQEFSAEQAREREPHVNCVAALYSPSSGIIDYAEVTRVLAREAVRAGADFRLGNTVQALSRKGSRTLVSTDSGDVVADVLINCAGLHSDRIARLAGLNPQSRIVPFRGEYFELTASRAELVRGLIYPVPNPDLPFLGVHLTASIHGGVHAGPNAVPALAREGYDWRTIRARDIGESLTHPGFWKLARTHAGSGVVEIRRSLSRKRFAASLATLVPGITAADLVSAPAGVRAQAIDRDGKLVDDFLIESAPGQVHVLNAPSPAATCSLQIAEHIAGLVPAN